MARLSELMFQEASKSIAESTPDVAQALQRGAQLAIQKRELQAKQEQVQQTQMGLNIKQDKSIQELISLANKHKDPKTKRMLLTKVLPAKVAAAGLGEVYTPEVLENFSTAPEMLAQAQAVKLFYDDQVARNLKTPAEAYVESNKIIQDPELLLKHGASKQFMASRNLSITEASKEKERELKRTELRHQKYNQVFQARSKIIEGRFKKINEKKASTRLAHSAINNVLADFKAGRKPSEIEYNAGSRAMAKVFNSGAMTDQDVADFRGLTGIENITGDAIRKWFTGGVNKEAAEQLLKLTKRVAQNIDLEAKAKFDESRSLLKVEGFTPEETAQLSTDLNFSAQLEPTLASEKKKQQQLGAAPAGKTLKPAALNRLKAEAKKALENVPLEQVRARLLKHLRAVQIANPEQVIEDILGGQ